MLSDANAMLLAGSTGPHCKYRQPGAAAWRAGSIWRQGAALLRCRYFTFPHRGFLRIRALVNPYSLI